MLTQLEVCTLQIFEYCDARTLALWECTSRGVKSLVGQRILQILNNAKLSIYQKRTLHLLKNVRPLHLHCILNKKCVLCDQPWKGGINESWGLPAHPLCVRNSVINVYYLRKFLPVNHMLSVLPHQEMEGFYNGCSMSSYSYKVVWLNTHRAVPKDWTLEWYKDKYQNLISIFVAQEESLKLHNHQLKLQARRQAAQEAAAYKAQWKHEFMLEVLKDGPSYNIKSHLALMHRVPVELRNYINTANPVMAWQRAKVVLAWCSTIPTCLWDTVYRVNSSPSTINEWGELLTSAPRELGMIIAQGVSSCISGEELAMAKLLRLRPELAVILHSLQHRSASTLEELENRLSIVEEFGSIGTELARHLFGFPRRVVSYRKAVAVAGSACPMQLWGLRALTVPSGTTYTANILSHLQSRV